MIHHTDQIHMDSKQKKSLSLFTRKVSEPFWNFMGFFLDFFKFVNNCDLILHKFNMSKIYYKSLILLWKRYVKPYVNNLKKNKANSHPMRLLIASIHLFFYASIWILNDSRSNKDRTSRCCLLKKKIFQKHSIFQYPWLRERSNHILQHINALNNN